eukprot:1796137-Amphidinium_carterae.1
MLALHIILNTWGVMIDQLCSNFQHLRSQQPLMHVKVWLVPSLSGFVVPLTSGIGAWRRVISAGKNWRAAGMKHRGNQGVRVLCTDGKNEARCATGHLFPTVVTNRSESTFSDDRT